MKKINAAKLNTPVVQSHRSFRRLVKQMFAVILKRQSDAYQDGFQSEVIQQLKNLEYKIEAVARAMTRHTKLKQ